MKYDNGWINVNDMPPKYHTNVIVLFNTVLGSRQVTTAKLTNNTVGQFTDRRVEKWYVTCSSGHQLDTVTHWRKIPDLPSIGSLT